MTLSVDDEITLVEVAVILIGIAITWAVYRKGGAEDDSSIVEPVGDREAEPRPPGQGRAP